MHSTAHNAPKLPPTAPNTPTPRLIYKQQSGPRVSVEPFWGCTLPLSIGPWPKMRLSRLKTSFCQFSRGTALGWVRQHLEKPLLLEDGVVSPSLFHLPCCKKNFFPAVKRPASRPTLTPERGEGGLRSLQPLITNLESHYHFLHLLLFLSFFPPFLPSTSLHLLLLSNLPPLLLFQNYLNLPLLKCPLNSKF